MSDQILAVLVIGLGVFGLRGFGLASLDFGFPALLGFLKALAGTKTHGKPVKEFGLASARSLRLGLGCVELAS